MTPPTLTSFTRDVPTGTPTAADTLVFLATFDEDVQNVNTTDFIVNGTTTATVTGVNPTSASTYEVTVSGGDLASFNGVVGLDLAGGQNIEDLATNALPAGEPTTDETYTLDNTAPSVEIQGAPATLSGVTPFDVTIQFFSEDVFGFVAGDITVINGAVTAFSPIDGDTYTATITPTGAGDVTIDVAAGVADDAVGNGNTAAPTVVVGNTIIEDTQKVIAKFMLNRANHILGNQPDLIDFVTGNNTSGGGQLGFLGINGNEEGMDLAFSTSRSKILASQAQNRIERAFAPEDDITSNGEEYASVNQNAIKDMSTKAQAKSNAHVSDEREEIGSSSYGQDGDHIGRAGTWDIWTEIYGSRSSSGTSDSSLWVGYLGFHTFVTDHMLVGVLGQLDWADETSSTENSNADGDGWMVGPYIAGKVPDKNVYYEARASWGRSSNNVSPIGTYTDSFDTTRWLVSAKLSGSYQFGDITIRPEARVSYFEETQESYTDNLTNLIPEQTISLGEVRFGPTISRSITIDDGTQVQPSIGVSGVWNFGIEENVASQGFALGNDDLRARLDGGLSITNTLGWTLALTGYYDGIGINDYDSYGGSVRLTVPLN